MLKSALAALVLVLTPALAGAQTYEPTPQLVEAAKAEGKVVWYTSADVAVSEKMGSAFEAKYPGIKVTIERSGAERVFQRISQEYASNIANVDVIETADPVHFVAFKRSGWLEAAVPSDVAKFWPATAKDVDGTFAAYRTTLSVIGYNTKAVKAEDAPKTHTDLLDPKWRGKIVKAHPAYSGAIMGETYALSQLIGWDYFEKLAQQRVMQVQSATDPPKKLATGERVVMADGSEYVMFQLQEKGDPVAIVYPPEGSSVTVGNAALLKKAPHPNAARLFYAFIFSAEAQQYMSDIGGLRSYHPEVKEKAGRKPLSDIKLIYPDAAKLEPEIEKIKATYEKLFGT